MYFLLKVISKLEIKLLLCLWLQIRLALKDWADVKTFEKDATVAQHFDVIYILQQLMFCKAFHFTATPSLVSFLSKYFKYILMWIYFIFSFHDIVPTATSEFCSQLTGIVVHPRLETLHH